MENNWSYEVALEKFYNVLDEVALEKFDVKNDYVKMVNDREREWMTALNIYLKAESFYVAQTGGYVMVPIFNVDDEFEVGIVPPFNVSLVGLSGGSGSAGVFSPRR